MQQGTDVVKGTTNQKLRICFGATSMGVNLRNSRESLKSWDDLKRVAVLVPCGQFSAAAAHPALRDAILPGTCEGSPQRTHS
jgi:hypothetical protein